MCSGSKFVLFLSICFNIIVFFNFKTSINNHILKEEPYIGEIMYESSVCMGQCSNFISVPKFIKFKRSDIEKSSLSEYFITIKTEDFTSGKWYDKTNMFFYDSVEDIYQVKRNEMLGKMEAQK